MFCFKLCVLVNEVDCDILLDFDEQMIYDIERFVKRILNF